MTREQLRDKLVTCFFGNNMSAEALACADFILTNFVPRGEVEKVKKALTDLVDTMDSIEREESQ